MDEARELFLPRNNRNRLEQMGRFRSWFYQFWWLLKALYFRLSPVRRLLLALAVLLLFIEKGPSINNVPLASLLLLLFILLLELKDKLLPRRELETGWEIQKQLMPTNAP